MSSINVKGIICIYIINPLTTNLELFASEIDQPIKPSIDHKSVQTEPIIFEGSHNDLIEKNHLPKNLKIIESERPFRKKVNSLLIKKIYYRVDEFMNDPF